MNVAWVLRIESAALAVLGAGVYLVLGGPPLLLIPLFLVPDLSAAGYLAGPRVGAVTYNLAHNWALVAILVGLSFATAEDAFLIAAAVLTAHVGADRALGYGLKLPTGFRDTHLGRIGRDRS